MRLTFSNLSNVLNIVNTIQTRFMVSFKINVPYCNINLLPNFFQKVTYKNSMDYVSKMSEEDDLARSGC